MLGVVGVAGLEGMGYCGRGDGLAGWLLLNTVYLVTCVAVPYTTTLSVSALLIMRGRALEGEQLLHVAVRVKNVVRPSRNQRRCACSDGSSCDQCKVVSQLEAKTASIQLAQVGATGSGGSVSYLSDDMVLM